jgi:hypothetical protein
MQRIEVEGQLIFGLTRDFLSVRSAPDIPRCALVWWDTLRDEEDLFFRDLIPGQTVNRIPKSNMMCRKAPMIRLLQRLKSLHPLHYSFFPETFLLPVSQPAFLAARKRTNQKYIVKPDGGALGIGIRIIEPKAPNPERPQMLHVAQEYLESRLLDGFKFDLRVYVLVTFFDELAIHVYRDGLVRVCADKYDTKSPFSQVTNTAVNRKKRGVKIEHITRFVSDVFPSLGNDREVAELWEKIHRIVALTVIAAIPYLEEGCEAQKKKTAGFRSFQLFGFDILLDRDLTPHLLEVNYRPSLGSDSKREANFKREMLVELWSIVLAGTSSTGELQSSGNQWCRFLKRTHGHQFTKLDLNNTESVPFQDILHDSETLSTAYDPAFHSNWKVPVMNLKRSDM